MVNEIQDSILAHFPPADSRKSYRLQCSLSLEEAAELESYLADPTMPFQGDISTLVRTLIRAGLTRLHNELKVEPNSFIQALKPTLGSELLKWSSAACDSFAVAATDHLSLTIESGDPRMGEDVMSKVAAVLEEVQNPSAKAMLKRALEKRGFIQALVKLRETMLAEGINVYHLDTTVSEVFS